MMLCAADENDRQWTCRNLGGISSEQALDFLVNVVPQNGLKVGFSLGYDWTKILQDVDRDVLFLLYHEQLRLTAEGNLRPVYWRHWRLNRQGAKTSIKDLRTGRHLGAWDSFRFFQCSFVNALTRWQMCSPEELERIARMKEERPNFAAADWSEGGDVERYCLEECRLLAQMMAELCRAWDATGLPRRAYHGAGTLGGAMFTKHELANHLAPLPEKMDRLVRLAYFGGRFECSFIGIIDRPVYGFDINSAYAYAEQFHPDLHGVWRRGPRSRKGLRELDPRTRFALIEVSWDLREGAGAGVKLPAWGPFPVRLKNGTIVYPAAGRGVYWLPEVQAAWRLFGERPISVRGAWEFVPAEPELRPFSFVPEYYERRLEWGKEGRGMILKLALAAGYGKTAQHVGKPKWHSLVWAGLTTSWTRAMLLDAIALASSPDQVVMLATDGLWALEELPLPISKKLGEWDSKTFERGVFVARPGVYFPLDAEEREEEWEKTVKARGISRKLLKDHADEMVTAWRRGESGIKLQQRRFIGIKSGLRGPEEALDEEDVLQAIEADYRSTTDLWPALRRYVLSRGGLARGDWSYDLIPGGIYRSHGRPPDLLAAEMPYECPEARGLWEPDEGSEGMLLALQRAWDAHLKARPRSKLRMGEWIENQPVVLSFDPAPKRSLELAHDRSRPHLLWADVYESEPYDRRVVSPEAHALRREVEMLMEQPDGWEIGEVTGLDALVPF